MTTQRDADEPLGSEVVVATGTGDPSDERAALGHDLATRLGVALRWLHVDPVEEMDLAAAIAEQLATDSVLVIHSEHANRWSGKWSIAEHVIDEWGGLAIATGPRHISGWGPGPVLVGVDGSEPAERAVATAAKLADLLGVGLVVCRVVSAALESEVGAIASELERCWSSAAPEGVDAEPVSIATPVGNDPISALVTEAEGRSCAAIVLSSLGDRTSQRASISRTCSGVIAGAIQPVVVVGSRLI